MDVLVQFAHGLGVILQPAHLAILIGGLVLGLIVAVLPGLTLVMGVVLALPFTYGMGIIPAIILLTAMYVSGTYGGAITSILFRIPGEPMDVPLLWDGYAMARGGEPALALGWTLFAAFAGGLVSAVAMVALAGPVASIALKLSTPEYFAVILLGLTTAVTLGGSSLANALISLAFGLLIATVGTDPVYGSSRFDFGTQALADGIDYILVMVGAYGIGEVLTRIGQCADDAALGEIKTIKTELPTLAEVNRTKVTLIRGSIIGFVIGVVPGAGATIASFISYGIEGQYGKNRAQLGHGIPEGIVAPQSAATASVGGAIVPLLTMGIPGSGATAIMMAAFMLHGIQPGPYVFFNSSDLVYAVFASVFASVLGMCVIGYIAIKGLVRVLYFPEPVTSAFVIVFCVIGAFAARSTIGDLWLLISFGIIGFLFERFNFPIAPMVLGAILGPLAESNFMTTMISFSNDWTIFFTRPVSGAIMVLVAVALIYPVFQSLRRKARTRKSATP
jgi:putative tricarboxylic transport membrane protein